MRYAIKYEIKRSAHLNLIDKVKGSKEWIRNLVIDPKSIRKLRLYLDACIINISFKRETYCIPTLDSIIEEMHGSKVFAKRDMREAYTS